MPFKNPHPLYHVWHSMIERCTRMTFKQWTDYGGRGITVCERWSVKKGVGFRNFLSDMGERPENFVIDRINNDLGYSPENCKWVSRKESQRNQRVTRLVVIEGKTYRAADLADICGVKTDTIVERAKQGLTYEQVIQKEKHHNLSGLSIGWKYGRGAKKHAINPSAAAPDKAHSQEPLGQPLK